MFKAVKMKRLKFLLLSFVLGCAMLAGAQTPEVFPLWPQGVKENNGIKVDRTVDDQGGISNNSTAELLVFHPDPAKNTGKAVLICPGGGYTYLARDMKVKNCAVAGEAGDYRYRIEISDA